MRRYASADLRLRSDGDAQLILSMAVAGASGDFIRISQNGRDLVPTEVADQHGTRLHVVDVGAGQVDIEYRLDLIGETPIAEYDLIDEIRYLRPSRYCESDTLRPIAIAEFSGLTGVDLLAGITSWVGQQLAYLPGSSLPTDGAVSTLISRRGVCRDFAHLVIALLRALDVPARLVSVYAPGLFPMDFHAVAEAYIDGGWHIVDATTLAPRESLMRIATGRDAADTAFLSTRGAGVDLLKLDVIATVDVLPTDDIEKLVTLS